MSFKKFSTEQDAQKKEKSEDKSKSAPADEQPDKTPSEVAPAPKP
jgi:hypothetical protein